MPKICEKHIVINNINKFFINIIYNSVDNTLNTILLNEEDIEKIEELLKKLDCDYYLDDGYNKTEYRKDCVKVVVNCVDKELSSKIVQYIKSNMDIHIYASRYHVNIINKNVNKRNALLKLIELEQLDSSKICVIGDNDNDYEMLEEFDGAVISKHHEILDSLKKKEVDSLKDYIDYLMK